VTRILEFGNGRFLFFNIPGGGASDMFRTASLIHQILLNSD